MRGPTKPRLRGIKSISVQGFKSIFERCAISIRPLTILAGANSSGKSSLMQALLLLKQTMESPYDVGPLLLNGPNVKFTSANQLVSSFSPDTHRSFNVAFAIESGDSVEIEFEQQPNNQGFRINRCTYVRNKQEITLQLDMTHDEIVQAQGDKIKKDFGFSENWTSDFHLSVQRDKCFLGVGIRPEGEQRWLLAVPASEELPWQLRHCIHIPGLRASPQRTYVRTAVQSAYPGTFDQYVASIIMHWQDVRSSNLDLLRNWLLQLGLTGHIQATALDDTQVELRVGRIPKKGRVTRKDTVSIADVGFGVSQVLPVLVSLLAAVKGQLVYIEQPELHLHPRAQVELAHILSAAIKRGVRVIIETHSSILLRAIQLQVLKGELKATDVKLHWFTRNQATGITEITSSDMNDRGELGDWPVDFEDVALSLEEAFLSTWEAKMFGDDNA